MSLKAEQQKKRRANETTEEAEERRRKDRERRANETAEEAKERRRKDRERKATATVEEAEERRRKDRERRANATAEEAEERRRKDRERQQKKRSAPETAEEAEERRRKDRERKQAERKRLSVDDKEQIKNQNRFAHAIQRASMSDEVKVLKKLPTQVHYLGKMTEKCSHCGALYFLGEQIRHPNGTFHPCCENGSVTLDNFERYPAQLAELFTGMHPESNNFLMNARNFNTALSIASMDCNLKNLPGRGPHVIKVHGQILYQASSAIPRPNAAPSYGQLFFIDETSAANHRLSHQANQKCNESLMRFLSRFIRQNHEYAQGFKMLSEVYKEEEEKAKSQNRTMEKVRLVFKTKDTPDPRRYNAPIVPEVAVVYVGEDNELPSPRSYTIHARRGGLQKIPIINQMLDPCTYPLYFIKGDFGWHPGRQKKIVGPNGNIAFKKLSQRQYYKYYISIRDSFNPIHFGKRLFQQFLVGSWANTEQMQLDWIKNPENQKKLRAENYADLRDYIADGAAGQCGKRVVLPATYTSSPRYMVAHYMDAMAITGRYGKPDLFTTYTCNPNWIEIKENLYHGQSPSDRADLIARVFRMKVSEFKKDIIDRACLGKVIAYIYTIERQKRDLPHIHLLITLAEEGKPRTSADGTVSKVISVLYFQNNIGRVYSATVKQVERYCIRLLLFETTGATSFQSLSIVNGQQFPSAFEAAKERDLIQTTDHFDQAMKDAAFFRMSYALRCVFVALLAFDEPTSAQEMWTKWKGNMSEDFVRKGRTPIEAEALAYYELLEMSSMQNIKLEMLINDKYAKPKPMKDIEPDYTAIGNDMYMKLNQNQKVAVDTVLTGQEKYIFLDGPGGSGKTFCYECIFNKMRGNGKKVACVAWTGIAANLLPGGRTICSFFKISTSNNYASSLKPNTAEGKIIKELEVIIIDECSMVSSDVLKSIDNVLRDIMNQPDEPFGGKIVLMGGDFRQVLPISDKPYGDGFLCSLKQCPLFSNFKKFELNENMRAHGESDDFKRLLLAIGEDKLPKDLEERIAIPTNMLSQGDLVQEVFEGVLDDPDHLSKRAILCAKNANVDKMNTQILARMNGYKKRFSSADLIVKDSEDDNFQLPIEVVNSLAPSGLPPHHLELKIGAVVMLTRNLNVKEGLCNGTRLQVLQFSRNNAIKCGFINGARKGQPVIIPRIDLLSTKEQRISFILKRRQFPLKLAFAMTINKAQGQSLEKVGVSLIEEVFSHGQLYVAMSRARKMEGIKLELANGFTRTSNIVDKRAIN